MLSALNSLEEYVDEALAAGESERALRALIQNVPRYPRLPQLRRKVASILLAHGRRDDAIEVLGTTATLLREAGDLLGAIACLRLLDNFDVDISGEIETLIIDVEDRGFGDDPDGVVTTESPDLRGDRPPLSLDGLLGVAYELALHPPPDACHRRSRFLPVSVLDAVPSSTLRWLTDELQVAIRRAGQSLVSEPTISAAWLIHSTYLGAPHGDFAAAAGTSAGLVGAVGDVTAGRMVSLLYLSTGKRAELLQLPGVAEAVEDARRRGRVHRGLTACSVFSALDDAGQERFLSSARLVRVDEGDVLLTPGERSAGLYVVLSGRVAIVDSERDIALGELERGAVLGESAYGGGRVEARYAASARTELCFVPQAACDAVFRMQDEAVGALASESENRFSAHEDLAINQGKALEEDTGAD